MVPRPLAEGVQPEKGETIRTRLIAAVALIALIALLVVAVAKSAPRPPVVEKLAKTITTTWKCQDRIGEKRTKAGKVFAKHSISYRKWQLKTWQARAEECRQWDWQTWLPSQWKTVIQCETQSNHRHYNSSYEGAYGFATSSWDAFRPASYPSNANLATPWQQYMVASRIHARYGFSGWGCKPY